MAKVALPDVPNSDPAMYRFLTAVRNLLVQAGNEGNLDGTATTTTATITTTTLVDASIPHAPNDAVAALAGVPKYGFYFNGSVLQVRLA